MLSGEASISHVDDMHVSPTKNGLLKVVQTDRVKKGQLVRLAKSIPPMIQQAIKTTLKPVVDKLGSLCDRIAVLENEVVSLREELDRRKGLIPPMDIDLNILPTVLDPTVADSIPLDDWCTGYSPTNITTAAEVQDSEPPHIEVPSPMYVAYQGGNFSDSLTEQSQASRCIE
ncbi:hypothetical protein HAX54_042886 [Datura stramonium]|uniref:Uncharacterized protein n=1 Tax=Datura stramonium TaxID=4076 RepID=A0ABS8W046_DATST|nr:hypothetical protein [Datura stramonium]